MSLKAAETWVKDQRCPEEWASVQEIRSVQSDALRYASIQAYGFIDDLMVAVKLREKLMNLADRIDKGGTLP